MYKGRIFISLKNSKSFFLILENRLLFTLQFTFIILEIIVKIMKEVTLIHTVIVSILINSTIEKLLLVDITSNQEKNGMGHHIFPFRIIVT